MRELSSEECKKIELRILNNVVDFCEKYGIKYSLAYGTLIGAIRHKGFIPWDDDIDIIMSRGEYDRFVSLYHDKYYQLIDGDHQSNHLHVKVSDPSTRCEFLNSRGSSYFYKAGLWIDVFPIDNVPDVLEDFYRLKAKIVRRFRLYRLSIYSPNKNPFKVIVHKVLKITLSSFFKNRLQSLVSTCKKIDSKTVGNLSLWYSNYPSFPAKYMDEYIEVDFEGRKYKSIKEYDSFLRGIYGDYMEYPPEDKRMPRHSYKAYVNDESCLNS